VHHDVEISSITVSSFAGDFTTVQVARSLVAIPTELSRPAKVTDIDRGTYINPKETDMALKTMSSFGLGKDRQVTFMSQSLKIVQA
jgi:hypothetical protein